MRTTGTSSGTRRAPPAGPRASATPSTTGWSTAGTGSTGWAPWGWTRGAGARGPFRPAPAGQRGRARGPDLARVRIPVPAHLAARLGQPAVRRVRPGESAHHDAGAPGDPHVHGAVDAPSAVCPPTVHP